MSYPNLKDRPDNGKCRDSHTNVSINKE